MNIELTNVYKRFGEKEVLRGVSLHIEQGQFVALLGPSGCGKTTLLNILAGLVDLDTGSVQVGPDVWSKAGYTRPPERRHIGMVFQDFALWPHMSVSDNVAFGLKLQGITGTAMRDRIHTVLKMVQMDGYERAFPHQLSGGQKQRIAIARALAPNPTIMLMDEPLSSLDAKLREQMRWDLLSLVKDAGITTIYVTHDQVEALSMADHVVLLNDGHIEQAGAPNDLYHRPNTTFAATFVGASNILSGHIAGIHGDSVGLHIGNSHFMSVGTGAIGSTVVMMIRPSDILMDSAADRDASDGGMSGGIEIANTVRGTILQRAFHGVYWQYRVNAPALQTNIEVWDAQERRVGESVNMRFPADKWRLVRDSSHALVAQI